MEKEEDALGGLAIQRRGRGFPDGAHAVRIHEFHDDGAMGAGTFGAGDFPGIGEPQLARTGGQFHAQIQTVIPGFAIGLNRL